MHPRARGAGRKLVVEREQANNVKTPQSSDQADVGSDFDSGFIDLNSDFHTFAFFFHISFFPGSLFKPHTVFKDTHVNAVLRPQLLVWYYFFYFFKCPFKNTLKINSIFGLIFSNLI